MIELRSDKIRFFILILAFRLVIDFAYGAIIWPVYAYSGFENHMSPGSEIISLIVLIAMTIPLLGFYENKDNRLSGEIVFMLFLMSFVPFTSYLGFGNVTLKYTVCNLIYWIILIALMLYRPATRIEFTEKIDFLGDTQIEIITVIMAMVVILVSGVYTHFRLNFDLSNVYELRAESKSFNMPTVLTYLFSWTRTVNAIILAYHIHNRKWLWAIMCVLVQILNFGIDGSKSTLFLTVFVVFISFLPRFKMKTLNEFILWGFLGISLLGIAANALFDNIMPLSLFVRRVLYLPVDIGAKYFDFFTTNTPDYFRQSVLKYLDVQSPYENVSIMIGKVYYGKETNCNNGLLSDAITNLGLIGVFVFPVMLALVFKVLDRCSEKLDFRIFIAVALYTAVTFTNSFLFTILLTHGLLFTMLLLLMMKREPEASQ